MIRRLNENLFVLDTQNTSYVINILPEGQPAHLYYGKRIHIEEPSESLALFENHSCAPGNTTVYSDNSKNLSLEAVKLEMSGCGKGDYDEAFVELTFADGGYTTDFIFHSAEIYAGKSEYSSGLPGAYGSEEEVSTLVLTLKDRHTEVYLKLNYYVFEAADVICRNAQLINSSDEKIIVDRLMSTQLDFDFQDECESGYSFTTFTGAWAREMNKTTRECGMGTLASGSACGASSNHANPFVMLHESAATETSGDVYGCNLVYSGNHLETVTAGAFGRLRFLSGINPKGFGRVLEKGETFETPEAVMTYTGKGFTALSRIYHRFINEHIVRGEWKKKARPVLFNSWESCYFDINDSNLLALAKKANSAGIELFVVDDGWFGKRNDDSSSLGDWYVNKEKFPNGMRKLSDKIHDMGMKFGIWVEPEMVNVNSELYGKHPEWVLVNPARNHSEGRNQRVLNLADTEVQDYLISALSDVFEETNCDYVKWDYNRNFSDVYSEKYAPERMKEIQHDYILGLYRVCRALTEKYPHILFEGCASGGNRFDLGILSFFPQIWASDDTDPICRLDIQSGYSYGYPMSVISAHVGSAPNHQTLRKTDIFTRYAVACFGQLGYEFNIMDMAQADFESMKKQIELYKKWRDIIPEGNFYRLKDNAAVTEWGIISRGAGRGMVMRVKKKAQPNHQRYILKLKGLRGDVKYNVFNVRRRIDVKVFGDLVNTMAPVHIKQDSLVHDIVAKVVKMQTPEVNITAYGDTLCNAGLQLPSAYGGTGYGEDMMVDNDYSAEVYYIKAIKE